MTTLSREFLESLVTRLNTPDVVGITCAGSHARGDADPHSDVDLQIYLRASPERHHQPYTMRYRDGRLVSLKSLTLDVQRKQLELPEEVIWAAPGLMQALILLDKDGSIAELKRAAAAVDWAALQPHADSYAVEQLVSCAEEAHKILNGLARRHESTVLYATWGMVKGLASAVAAQRHILIETENRYLELLQESVGGASAWTRAFRLALGADLGPVSVPPFRTRGMAALDLYEETAALFEPIIPPADREVISTTLHRIQSAADA